MRKRIRRGFALLPGLLPVFTAFVAAAEGIASRLNPELFISQFTILLVQP